MKPVALWMAAGGIALAFAALTAQAQTGAPAPANPAPEAGQPGQPAAPATSAAAPRPAPTLVPQLTLAQRQAQLRSDPVALGDWSRRPTDAEISAAYPAAAFEGERGGRVVLLCTVTEAFTLTDCSVRSDYAENLGFGQAALGLASLYQASPAADLRSSRYSYVSDTGQTVMVEAQKISLVGAKVLVGVEFSYLKTYLIRQNAVKLTNAELPAETTLSGRDRAVAMGLALLEIGQRNLSSEGIRTALRDMMIKNPAVRTSMEQFVYYYNGAKTDTFRIERLASGLIQAVRVGPAGGAGVSMRASLTAPGEPILGEMLSAPVIPMDSPLPEAIATALQAKERAASAPAVNLSGPAS